MKYYLGIDGGGTKTAICIINENKEIIDVKVGKPSSIDTVTLQDTKNNIEEIINQLNISFDITTCFAGLGGVSSIEDKVNVKNILKTINKLKNTKIVVDNDIISALVAGNGKEQGMAVIIGTGSVVYGDNGIKTHRCGGYCHQEGDAGSAFDLGIKALRYLAKVMDKRLKETEFSKILMKELNCYTQSELIKQFQKTRTEIAQIARIVTKFDHLNESKEIISTSVEEIIEMTKTVYNVLNFDEVTLAITGSLGNAKTYYKEYLFKRINEELPKVKIQKAIYEAYYGAALKAYLIDKNE